MPEQQLYRNMADAIEGFVTAPAGCGKTEAIIQCVKMYCDGKQLILTHTNAGVLALKKRFEDNAVSKEKYHIETISGWALGWVSKYPFLSEYRGTLPIPISQDWPLIYKAASKLLDVSFIKWVIKNSYAGVLVDEYQDCTLPMHDLVLKIKAIMPCRVLGDPLQGIFSLNPADPLVEWDKVKTDFNIEIGALLTPYRWIKGNNRPLGDYLIGTRPVFEQHQQPQYDSAFITVENIDPAQKANRIQQLARSLTGTMCVIGPKHGNISSSLLSALVNVGFIPVEPNDLPDLKGYVNKLITAPDNTRRGNITAEFLLNSYAGISTYKSFVEGILGGTLSASPRDPNRKSVYQNHPHGFNFQLILDLIKYIETEGLKCKRYDSVHYLKLLIEEHLDSNEDITTILSKLIAKRKIIGRGRPNRCVGSTLLLKGLEFDHAIILYNANDNGWNDVRDMYVAITRGAKSIHIIQF